MPNTLLEMLSSGKYKTSKDLPGLKEILSTYKAQQNESFNRPITKGGKNIFGKDVPGLTVGDLNEMIMGMAGIMPLYRGGLYKGVPLFKDLIVNPFKKGYRQAAGRPAVKSTDFMPSENINIYKGNVVGTAPYNYELYTSGNPNYARGYALARIPEKTKSSATMLRFEVPTNYLGDVLKSNKNMVRSIFGGKPYGRAYSTIQREKIAEYLFPRGLPKEFLSSIEQTIPVKGGRKFTPQFEEIMKKDAQLYLDRLNQLLEDIGLGRANQQLQYLK